MLAVLGALLANGLITILKFIAALVTRSSGMMAEALHSLADTTNQISKRVMETIGLGSLPFLSELFSRSSLSFSPVHREDYCSAKQLQRKVFL